MKDYDVSEIFSEGEYEILVCTPKNEEYYISENSLENLSSIITEYQKNNRSCED